MTYDSWGGLVDEMIIEGVTLASVKRMYHII